jgi:protein SCO1
MTNNPMSDKLSRRLVCRLTGLLAADAALGWSGGRAAAEPYDLGHQRPRGMNVQPLYQLITQTGEPLARDALKGRPFVIAFGFTQCPDICPTTLIDLSNQLASLGPDGSQLTVLFMSVDPEHDTAAHLRAYLASFDSRIIGLTGNPVDIAAAAHALEIAYQRVNRPDGSYSVDHTYKVYYFDRFGLLAASVDLLKTPPARVQGLLKRLLSQ